MSRRMSVSMTLDAVYARQKTVTRRHVDTWRNLKAGDRLTLIEKGMGLPKGAKQVVVCEVEIVDVRVEPLGLITTDEVRAEGFAGHMDCHQFREFWCRGHGYPWNDYGAVLATPCRRIEWRYVNEATR